MTYMDWASGYYHPPFELVDWEECVESVVLETSAQPSGNVRHSAHPAQSGMSLSGAGERRSLPT